MTIDKASSSPHILARRVSPVVTVTVEELRQVKRAPAPEAELRRAKDHLKGSLMLSLENTASRMSHLARQEIYFDRQFGLDETLEGVERVTAEDVQRVVKTYLTKDNRTVGQLVGRGERQDPGARRAGEVQGR